MNGLFASEVLKKTTKIFAGKNIQVFMEGFAPRVVYDTITKEPKSIYLPNIPDNIEPKLLGAIHGLLDHECGHILESSNDDICDNSKSQFWHYIHNCIDDPRVNQRMSERYPGCFSNIRNAYNYIFEMADPTTGVKPYDKSAVDAIDFTDDEAVKDAQVKYSPVWFAYRSKCKFNSEKYEEIELERLYAPLEAKMNPDKIKALGEMASTDDVVKLTDYFVDFFRNNLSDSSGSGGKDGTPSKATTKATKGRLEDLKKLEDQLSEAIELEIEHLAKKAKSNIHFTDRFDLVVDGPTMLSNGYSKTSSVLEFETKTKTITNYLSKDLRRLLESRNRRWYTGGYRSGRLNQKVLHSVKAGNDRIFSRKSEIREVKAAVSLLVDLSGSMKGERALMAIQSAYAFAMVLEQLKVPYEVWGFTTVSPHAEKRKAYDEFIKDKSPGLVSKVINHSCPDLMYCFKSFEHNLDIIAKSAMVKGGMSELTMSSNEDSLHVKRALERLGKRPEDKKTLFVFSDGKPAFLGPAQQSMEMLKYLDTNSKKLYGVDIFAIGINSNDVSKYYKNYKVVTDLKELPAALFEFLRARI